MIRPIEYINFAKQAATHRILLARVALNILYDPEVYPVDLTEVSGLPPAERAMAYGFLGSCAIDHSFWPENHLTGLITIANGANSASIGLGTEKRQA